MTGDRKNIDNLFRNGLNGLRERTPVHAWGRLDHALDVAGKRRRMMYFRLAAASVLVLMAFGAGFFYASYMRSTDEVATQEIPKDDPTSRPSAYEFDGQGDEQPTPVTPGDNLSGPGMATSDEASIEQPSAERQEPGETLVAETVLSDSSEPGSHKPAVDDQALGWREQEVSTLARMTMIETGSFETGEDNGIAFASKSEEKPAPTIYAYYPEDFITTPVTRHSKWIVGAQFAPTYSYREISANYGTNVSGNQRDVMELNDVEEGILSYSGGVDIGYNFSEKWSIQSGMYFSRIGQSNSDALEFKQSKDEFLLYAINTSTGNINVAFERVPENVRKFNAPKDSIGPGVIGDVKVIQQFDFFEIPLLIRYKFLNRKFSMNLTGGLSPAYLLGNNTYLETQDNKYDVGDAGNLNTMIMNTSIGMGFGYSLTKKLSVNFEPTFKYSLNPINNSSNINYHPYSFSWFTGIRLKIN